MLPEQQKRRAGERFWEWLAPTMPRSNFRHLTYRTPYEQLFDLSRFMKPKEEVKKKRGLLEYYDSDKQIESWEREKEKLQEVCDDLHRQFIDLDMGGDAVVTKTKFKQVLVQYVA